MNLENKKTIETIIIDEISFLEKELVILYAQLKPVEKVCSLDACYHESLEQEQKVLTTRYEEYTLRLKKLQLTLPKIYKDDYGVCEECEEDIAFERLKLLPESLFCVSCLNNR